MFQRLRRFFGRSDDDERRRFFATVRALNAQAGGGEPDVVASSLGRLKLRSGTLALGDPQCSLDLEVPGIVADAVEISASLWRYPSGMETVIELRLTFGPATSGGVRRKVDAVGIDSAKLVVADAADTREHWTEVVSIGLA